MSLFDYGQGKSHIGSSNFDESFQNLYTTNFGRLNPVGCFEVLAGDKWKIAENALTKVAPMPAPAFTRMKQNFYSFFVPNAITWKHWNDFITNGSAYLDTYGNNQTNQEITNQWQQPSIPANMLQLIAKIANGWAIPVWRLNSDRIAEFNQYLKAIVGSYLGLNSSQFQIPSGATNLSLSSFFWLLCKSENMPEFFQYIPYFNMKVVNDGGSLSCTHLCIGCDSHTAFLFFEWLRGRLYFVNDSVPSGSTSNVSDSTMNDSGETQLRSYFDFVTFRFFCDPTTNDPRVDRGPFLLEKYSYVSSATGDTISSYRYLKNLTEIQDFNEDAMHEYTPPILNDNVTAGRYRIVRNIQRAGMWSRSLVAVYRSYISDERQNSLIDLYVNGSQVLHVNFRADSGVYVKSDYVPSIDDVPWVLMSDDYIYNCGCKLVYDNLSSFNLIAGESVNDLGDFWLLEYSGAASEHPMSPFYQETACLRDNVSYISAEYGEFSQLGGSAACDVNFPLYGVNNSSAVIYRLPYGDLISNVSRSLGFDAVGFMIYQCIQSSRLLDYFNIPLEGLCSRSWEDYAGELVNALPFFAYSKIYNDYFRNKTVTSAELDFCHTNGVAWFSQYYITYLRVLKGFGFKFSKQVERLLTENKVNSWVIPMSTAPRSGLTNYTRQFSESPYFISFTRNEYHYLNIISYFELFELLVGDSLTDMIVFKMVNFATKRSVSDSVYIHLSGLLLDNIYLPNYYNGLLHMKYQNFSKDYFSSALLDPMHGANQVSVGDTISELRSGVIEQGFWETTAFRRSVRKFFQGLFGTTPTHGDETSPILLGVDHISIDVGEVLQTSQTTETSPQGTRSGIAASHGKGGLCKHFFNEQGYIIILSSVTVEQQYLQGLERMWTPLESFLDYPFVQFSGIGNESIPMRELTWQTPAKYTQPRLGIDTDMYDLNGSKVLYDGRTSPLFVTNAGSNVSVIPNVVRTELSDDLSPHEEIFGFIPRYSAYKFKLDQCHGAFRNQMDYWQSFRKFYKTPMLVHEFVNWEFVADDGDLNRLFAVEDDTVSDKFYVDCFINALVSRKLPYVCRPKTGV